MHILAKPVYSQKPDILTFFCERLRHHRNLLMNVRLSLLNMTPSQVPTYILFYIVAPFLIRFNYFNYAFARAIYILGFDFAFRFCFWLNCCFEFSKFTLNKFRRYSIQLLSLEFIWSEKKWNKFLTRERSVKVRFTPPDSELL